MTYAYSFCLFRLFQSVIKWTSWNIVIKKNVLKKVYFDKKLLQKNLQEYSVYIKLFCKVSIQFLPNFSLAKFPLLFVSLSSLQWQLLSATSNFSSRKRGALARFPRLISLSRRKSNDKIFCGVSSLVMNTLGFSTLPRVIVEPTTQSIKSYIY